MRLRSEKCNVHKMNVISLLANDLKRKLYNSIIHSNYRFEIVNLKKVFEKRKPKTVSLPYLVPTSDISFYC